MLGRPGTFWVMDLQGQAAQQAAPACPVVYSLADPTQVGEIAAMTGEGESAAANAARLMANGRRCYAGRVEGALAAYGWLSFDHEDIGEQGLRLKLPPGDAYVWNCVTAPAYRRRGVYSGLLAHIAVEMRAEGLRRLWIGADASNLPSQKGMARAGFRPVLELYTLQLFGRRWHWFRRRPGASRALFDDAKRVLMGR